VVVAQSNARDNIDSSNYYNYYSDGSNLKDPVLTTGCLNVDDATPIIREEMEKAGVEWIFTGSIFKIQSGQTLVLTAYSRKSNFGFLYNGVHGTFPNKDDRKTLIQSFIPNVAYVQTVETYLGKVEFVRIKELPSNVFILNSSCYWYQYTKDSEDNNKLITKEIAKKILRQDVQKYLQQAGVKTKFLLKQN
jgi:hypothetical protein